jgi:hypothetical protein
MDGFQEPSRRGLALAAAVLLASCAVASTETGAGSDDPRGGGSSSSSSGSTSGSSGASSSGGSSSSSGGSSSSSGGSSSSSGGSSSSSGGGSSSSSGSSGGSGSSSSSGAVVGHPRRVLLSDEGNGRVLLVDLGDTAHAVWATQLDHPRDLQLVGGDRVAVSTATGYVELDLARGEIKRQVGGFSGVETLRRLADGHTVLGGNSSGGVTLQELDGADAAVPGRKVTFTTSGQVRIARRTPRGTFLIAAGAKLAEVDWSRQTVWEVDVPDGNSVFEGLRLADGTIAVTSGYGATIVIIDASTKRALRTIGGKAQPDAPTIAPNFYAGFQVLANGHFVVTNWEGHGAGNGGKGVQLLEYDPAGLLVWRWKQDPALVSSLHQVLVLDGLDTTRLHDDAGGVLAPVNP